MTSSAPADRALTRALGIAERYHPHGCVRTMSVRAMLSGGKIPTVLIGSLWLPAPSGRRASLPTSPRRRTGREAWPGSGTGASSTHAGPTYERRPCAPGPGPGFCVPRWSTWGGCPVRQVPGVSAGQARCGEADLWTGVERHSAVVSTTCRPGGARLCSAGPGCPFPADLSVLTSGSRRCQAGVGRGGLQRVRRGPPCRRGEPEPAGIARSCRLPQEPRIHGALPELRSKHGKPP